MKRRPVLFASAAVVGLWSAWIVMHGQAGGGRGVGPGRHIGHVEHRAGAVIDVRQHNDSGVVVNRIHNLSRRFEQQFVITTEQLN